MDGVKIFPQNELKFDICYGFSQTTLVGLGPRVILHTVCNPTNHSTFQIYIQWLLGTKKIFSFALGQNTTYLSIIYCW